MEEREEAMAEREAAAFVLGQPRKNEVSSRAAVFFSSGNKAGTLGIFTLGQKPTRQGLPSRVLQISNS